MPIFSRTRAEATFSTTHWAQMRRMPDDKISAVLDPLGLGRQRVFGAEPGALEIDREHRLPLRLGHLDRIEIGVDAGVVDEHVDSSGSAEHVLDAADDVGFDRHIGGDEIDGTGPGELANSTRRFGSVDVEERDARPFGEALLDDRAPDAARSARDEGHPICKTPHGPISYAGRSAETERYSTWRSIRGALETVAAGNHIKSRAFRIIEARSG